MPLIGLEEHVLPADLVTQVWPTPMGAEALIAKLVDAGEQRLWVMDAQAGIDMQVLSVTVPGPQQVPAEQAWPLSLALNDRVAEMVAAHPNRFQALASLPTQDPAAATVEVKRAITELGFRGVIINGHTGGRFLDAPELDELLGTIADLAAPIYLHPTFPPPQVAEVYFGGLPPRSRRAPTPGRGAGTPRPACTCCAWPPPACSPATPSCRSSWATWARTCRFR